MSVVKQACAKFASTNDSLVRREGSSGLPRTLLPKLIAPPHVYHRRFVMMNAIYARVSTVSYSQRHTIGEQIDRLRDHMRLGGYDHIMVTSPDHLARNYVHQMILLEEFERARCTVEFLDQPVGDAHLVLQIGGAVAKYVRMLIGDRMRRHRLARYRAGLLLLWGRTVYGYLLDPDHLRDPAPDEILEGVDDLAAGRSRDVSAAQLLQRQQRL
jgi:DNA invertase Pin-like site-specific DNA recombinase